MLRGFMMVLCLVLAMSGCSAKEQPDTSVSPSPSSPMQSGTGSGIQTEDDLSRKIKDGMIHDGGERKTRELIDKTKDAGKDIVNGINRAVDDASDKTRQMMK